MESGVPSKVGAFDTSLLLDTQDDKELEPLLEHHEGRYPANERFGGTDQAELSRVGCASDEHLTKCAHVFSNSGYDTRLLPTTNSKRKALRRYLSGDQLPYSDTISCRSHTVRQPGACEEEEADEDDEEAEERSTKQGRKHPRKRRSGTSPSSLPRDLAPEQMHLRSPAI